MESDVVSNVLKEVNLKDKLTDDDMTKLGFCILTEMLATHKKLDKIPVEAEQKRHMLAGYIIDFLGFDEEKMRIFGYTEFAKYGFGDGVPGDISNISDEDGWVV